MNILITGGGGFIGYYLSNKMLFEGNFVRICDLKFSDKVTYDEEIDLMEGDLRDLTFCKACIKNIDIVFHFAGKGHGEIFSLDKHQNLNIESYKDNLNITVNILNACINSSVKKIVFSSSAAVYGDVLNTNEDCKISPQSPYAVSKTCQEYFFNIFSKVYGLNITILRYFNVYGYNPLVNPINSNIIHKFIYLMKNGKSPLLVGNIDFHRDYVYIDDIVNITYIASNLNKFNGEVFNIGTGISVDLLYVVKIINNLLGSNLQLMNVNRKYNSILNSIANTEKSVKMLNYECKTQIEDGIRKIIKMM